MNTSQLEPTLEHKMLCIRMRLAASRMLMGGKEMFARAREMYKSNGIGAFVVIFASVPHMTEAIQTSQFDVHYFSLEQVVGMNYKHGEEMVCKYDPVQEFVLLVGVQLAPTVFSYTGCVAPKNIDEVLRRGLLVPPEFLVPPTL